MNRPGFAVQRFVHLSATLLLLIAVGWAFAQTQPGAVLAPATQPADSSDANVFNSPAECLQLAPSDSVPTDGNWSDQQRTAVNPYLQGAVGGHAIFHMRAANIERTGEGRYNGLMRVIAHQKANGTRTVIYEYFSTDQEQKLATTNIGDDITIDGKITSCDIETDGRLVINVFVMPAGK